MRQNYSQPGTRGENNRTYLDNDWFTGGIPPNVSISKDVYIDSSYGFAEFRSVDPNGLFFDEGSGCYDRSSFIVSEKGKIFIGKFSILNGTTIIATNSVIVGSHCMLAWGTVITDCWFRSSVISLDKRSDVLQQVSRQATRPYPFAGEPAQVILEDNVWIGFDSVIMPGVTLGRGCVVGCKTIITENIPPYAVVTGNPAKVVRYLSPDDTEERKQLSLNELIKC